MRPLVVALLVAGCYHGSAAPAPTPPANMQKTEVLAHIADDPLAFLPVESDIVLGVDFARLRDSQLWREQLEPLLVQTASDTFQKVRSQCGFDPLSQLQRASVAYKKLDDTHNDGTFVVHGVDSSHTVECIAKASAKTDNITHDGSVVMVSKPGDEVVLAIAPLGRTGMVIQGAPHASRVSIEDRMHIGAPLRTSRTFMTFFNRLEPTASLWLVINGNSAFLASAKSMGVSPTGVDMTLTVTDKYVVAARITTASAADATQLASLANQVSPQARAMVETFDVRADDNVVRVDIVITAPQAQTLLTMLGGIVGP
jgi:hypothetical protein